MLHSNWLIIATLCLALPQALLADESIREELSRCAVLDDVSLRLACYDKLGGRHNSTPAAVNAAAAPRPAAAPSDTPGSEGLRGNDKEDGGNEDTTVTVHVTRCVKNARKKYIFYLEGDQVWKQVSDKKLLFKECDFDVTISKDFFGYKMQLAGEKLRFRVSRVR